MTTSLASPTRPVPFGTGLLTRMTVPYAPQALGTYSTLQTDLGGGATVIDGRDDD